MDGIAAGGGARRAGGARRRLARTAGRAGGAGTTKKPAGARDTAAASPATPLRRGRPRAAGSGDASAAAAADAEATAVASCGSRGEDDGAPSAGGRLRKVYASESVTLGGETCLPGACAALRAALAACARGGAVEGAGDVCAAVRGVDARLESEMRRSPRSSGGVGVLRLEVPVTLPRHALRTRPMDFLELVREHERSARAAGGGDAAGDELGEYGFYFSSRVHSGADTDEDCTSGADDAGVRAEQIVAACHGAALLWTSSREGSGGGGGYADDLAEIEELTLGGGGGGGGADGAETSRLRVFGGMRFDASASGGAAGARGASAEIGEEWRRFGTHVFMLPRVELLEDDATGVYLAVSLAWETPAASSAGASSSSFGDEVAVALRFVAGVQEALADPASVRRVENAQCRAADFGSWEREAAGEDPAERVALEPAFGEWERTVGGALREIEQSGRTSEPPGPGPPTEGEHLEKVVLARRMAWSCASARPLALLRLLRQRNGACFHLALLVPGGDAFVSATPERLFARRGARVCSEAMAGTRQRGARAEDDAALAFDLMMNGKDGAEFAVVREQIVSALRSLCGDGDGGGPDAVAVLSKKEVMRQAHIQHLYSRVDGVLRAGVRSSDVLEALHPTPAVCGHPRAAAAAAIGAMERFDRGFYAGPVGWMSASGADFAVAIRSALLRGGAGGVLAYSGVGIVSGSDAAAEWRELDLKARQFSVVLAQPPLLRPTHNVNLAHARAMVAELLRLGVCYYVVCPGSRSSPLALALGENDMATFASCIDERSAAFHALGYGIATNSPAAVVTSSGTATANLLPAAMEANEARVPMLLLTADRPPELHGIGANQSVDQRELYGAHVRAAYQLPPPEPAASGEALRHTLTLVGEAAARATAEPRGPVHINCMFREPLAPAPAPADADADADARAGVRALLESSRGWAEDTVPFVQQVPGGQGAAGALPAPARGAISRARRGMIVAGNIRPEEIGAVVGVARALGWPVVADVTSGLRLRSAGVAGATVVHQMDQMLAAGGGVRARLAPDCLLQFGARIVSKRLLSFIADLADGADPCPLVLVGEDLARTDPTNSRCVRVRDSADAFAARLRADMAAAESSAAQREYTSSLRFLSGVASRKIALLCAEQERQHGGQLSEPAIASIVSSTVPRDHALFLGNSMPIRDVDMFGSAAPAAPDERRPLWQLPRVVANRGASGIDGVLSTAIGYASASRAPTTLLVGDVSFVHDTNGLLMLRDAHGGLGATNLASVPPMTIVVVNNAGGGIFGFLPIAEAYENDERLRAMWETPPDVNIESLARAHKLNYRRCVSAAEVREALVCSWRGESKTSAHTIVEVLVITDKRRNVELHAEMTREVRRAIEHACELALAGGAREGSERPPGGSPRVGSMRYRRHEFRYAEPVVSGRDRLGTRRGLTLEVRLEGGAVGRADVSPLPGFHRETLREAEAQVSMVCDLVVDRPLPPGVALLDGRLDEWLALTLGGSLARTLHPSVRCGVEAAILNAVAAHTGSASIAPFVCHGARAEGAPRTIANNGVAAGVAGRTPAGEIVASVRQLVGARGFRTVKLKVGRSEDPAGEARAVSRVCEAMRAMSARGGPDAEAEPLKLRLDANRLWSYESALAFARALDPGCAALIEYIEEPVSDPALLSKFHAETLMPIALDETVDELACACARGGGGGGAGEGLARLMPYLQDPAVVAVVMKPNVLGSVELIASLARQCRSAGVKAVLSNTFESSLMVRFYYQLALGVDSLLALERPEAPRAAHGLGTLEMLATDVLRAGAGAPAAAAPAAARPDVAASNAVLSRSLLNEDAFTTAWMPAPTLTRSVDTDAFSFNVVESRLPPAGAPEAEKAGRDVLVFLHGFLGDAVDWLPIMNSLADESRRCVAIDLPEHGRTRRRRGVVGGADGGAGAAFDAVVDNLVQCVDAVAGADAEEPRSVTLVGYSMGGRLAYAAAARMAGAAGAARRPPTVVALSASPGIEDAAQRARRLLWDEGLARQLLREGPARFVRGWYEGGLWEPLRRHPHFGEMRDRRIAGLRARADSLDAFAAFLLEMSPGARPAAFESLRGFTGAGGGLFALVGERDAKYVGIADDMVARAIIPEAARIVVAGSGHALHIESPGEVAEAIRRVLAGQARSRP